MPRETKDFGWIYYSKYIYIFLFWIYRFFFVWLSAPVGLISDLRGFYLRPLRCPSRGGLQSFASAPGHFSWWLEVAVEVGFDVCLIIEQFGFVRSGWGLVLDLCLCGCCTVGSQAMFCLLNWRLLLVFLALLIINFLFLDHSFWFCLFIYFFLLFFFCLFVCFMLSLILVIGFYT